MNDFQEKAHQDLMLLIEKIKAGEVTGLAIVAAHVNGRVSTFDGGNNPTLMLGGIEVLRASILAYLVK